MILPEITNTQLTPDFLRHPVSCMVEAETASLSGCRQQDLE